MRRNLPGHIEAFAATSPYASQGVIPRLENAWAAARVSAEVHHVVGDIHYVALALPPSRTVVTVLDCVSLHRLVGLRRTILRALWYELPLAQARTVTTISEFTRQELLHLTSCNPVKVRVIYCPLPDGFAPVARSFQGSHPRLLCVGTSPNKNLGRIAAALEGIPCDVHLVGVPTSEQKSAFLSRKVTLVEHGDVPDAQLPAIYSQADALLFPSTYEGFGMPIIEAQAMGRPVITSTTGSMPEVAGPAALFVDPMDPISIRTAVQRLSSDPTLQQRLVNLGFENTRRFDRRQVAQAYADVYAALAGASASPSPALTRRDVGGIAV